MRHNRSGGTGGFELITLDMALDALDAPAITEIETEVLDAQDVLNLILQRSEIIRDQPRYNRYIKAWTQGDDAPLLDLIERMGRDELVRRAAAFIYLEYKQLRPIFEKNAPQKVADIGCGYALFDLFLAKEFESELILIDLESNDNRHFGFKSEGAAYSSLENARRLLKSNGIPDHAIDTRNPETDDLGDVDGLDYAMSFISCGYHYPWDTYETFFQDAVKPDGRLIIDFRAGRLSEAALGLSKLGFMRIVEKAANNSADRVLIVKSE